MKKLITLTIALALAATMVACGGNTDEITTGADNTTTGNVTTTAPDVTTETPTPEKTPQEIAAAANAADIANALNFKYAELTGLKVTYDDFVAESQTSLEKYSQYVDMTAEEFDAFVASLANDAELNAEFSWMVSGGQEAFNNEIKSYVEMYQEFADMTSEDYFAQSMIHMEYPAGTEFLSGFTTTITGYSEAHQFGPGQMGVAFIGYIFRVAEGTDIEAFKITLNENHDLRWNWCTSADTVICESYGDLVYFGMLVTQGDMGGFTEAQKNEFIDTFYSAIETSADAE